MGHQPEYVARAITDAGNVVSRAVWVRRFSYCSALLTIPKDDPVLALQLCEGRIVAYVVSFGMCNRNSQYRSGGHLVGVRRVRSFNAHREVFANKVQISVADQSAR